MHFYSLCTRCVRIIITRKSCAHIYFNNDHTDPYLLGFVFNTRLCRLACLHNWPVGRGAPMAANVVARCVHEIIITRPANVLDYGWLRWGDGVLRAEMDIIATTQLFIVGHTHTQFARLFVVQTSV